MVAAAQFHYNPFSLTTEQQGAIGNVDNPLFEKITSTISRAFYDIFIKNPYEITIGNFVALTNSPVPLTTATKFGVGATIALGSLYSLMLHGGSTHMLGIAIQKLGNLANVNTINSAGNVAKTVGKYLFYAGAIPTYGLFYALPKYLI